MSYHYDANLAFLEKCSDEELAPLVEILIKDKDGKLRYTEELTKSLSYKEFSPKHHKYWREIAGELQRFGGNSIANFFRSKGISYREILLDVCSTMRSLKHKVSDTYPTYLIEDILIDNVLEEAVNELSNEKREKLIKELNITNTTNIALPALLITYMKSLLLQPVNPKGPIFYAVKPALETLIAGTALGRILGVATGPIGWALSGVWAIYDIAGPAKRVTIPAVIQIAFLRKKYLTDEEKTDLENIKNNTYGHIMNTVALSKFATKGLFSGFFKR